MKKILSVIIAVSCMAVLFVGCSAENGKIGNGVNGTVTDNQSNVSSNHNNASAGMNSSMGGRKRLSRQRYRGRRVRRGQRHRRRRIRCRQRYPKRCRQYDGQPAKQREHRKRRV